MARQRSRVDWLKEGDRNTSFFHARASARRRNNKINFLRKADGSKCEDPEQIRCMVYDFYATLFTSEPSYTIDAVLEAIPKKVTEDMNEALCREYTNDEIKTALFQMGPTKAPGPDGFPALFYQKHWDLLEEDICAAVKGFLMGHDIPEGFCDSVIILIPKCNNADALGNFRPISLCNVIYKIASKVIANRLKIYLPEIISEQQSAFVPGRLITDNVLIAYESLHTIRKQKAKCPFFALKVDMTKAYDRVEWSYLKGVLLKLGFKASWVDMTMRCVTSVKYAVRVNGELTDSFIPTRGIRQGDPISPYLFLLCVEGLSCLLQKKEESGLLKGIRNGKRGPSISHLLFADDSIFFTKGDDKNVNALKSALQTYCDGSGQRINLHKSSIFFGPHCEELVKDRIKQKVGVQDDTLHDTYLGMPTWVGRSPSNSFNFLTGRLWKQLNGWSDRPLSRAGKEVLLKAVAQAIPTYVMSCFQIPVGVCEKLRKPISNFWWGVDNGKKKVHWKSWDWLSSPKYLGGMGFRDMAIFNQAMLGKQCWRLLTEPHSLCARVMKGRYFPDGDFWSAQCPRSSSYTWRSIMHGKKLLQQGILWRVGDGKTISILKDNWIPEVTPGTFTTSYPLIDNQTVSALMDGDGKHWNTYLVKEIFPTEISRKILSIPISAEGCNDFPSWPYTKNGIYSVRSAYNLARSQLFWKTQSSNGKGASSKQEIMEKAWKKLWAINCPNKMKVVLWRMAHNCLPTGTQLQVRSIPTRYDCYFCNRGETIEHCFLQCEYVKEIWKDLKKEYGICLNLKSFSYIRQWLLDWISEASEFHSMIMAVASWHIWDNRNSCRNGEALLHPLRVSGKIKAHIDFILGNNTKSDGPIRRESLMSSKKWTPPLEGQILVNVDAATFSNTGKSGYGIVVRNHLGIMQAACRGCVDNVQCPEVAEAEAIRRALMLAESIGAQSFQVASDCLSLVNKLQQQGLDRTSTGAIVHDIKLRAKKFVSCTFKYVHRACNEAAHVLARSAEHDQGTYWLNEPPEIIRTIICNEQLLYE